MEDLEKDNKTYGNMTDGKNAFDERKKARKQDYTGIIAVFFANLEFIRLK